MYQNNIVFNKDDSISGDNFTQLDEVATTFNEEYDSLCELKKYVLQAARPAEIEHYENLRMEAVMAYHDYRVRLSRSKDFVSRNYKFELSRCKYTLNEVANYYYKTFYTDDGQFGNDLAGWFADFSDLTLELNAINLPVPLSAKAYFMLWSGFNGNSSDQDFRDHLMNLYYGTEFIKF